MRPEASCGLKGLGLLWLCGSLGVLGFNPTHTRAADHFLVLAGGYSPAGNQASLEANTLFFREVLNEQHHGDRSMTTYFADGFDEKADLQYAIQIAQSSSPATALLSSLMSSRGSPNTRIRYRNHRVDDIAGPLEPEIIHSNLRRQGRAVKPGDRLFIYVTAHGSKAKGDNAFNTAISCWDRKPIRVSEFENWLDEIPAEVPVIMVMAQCYCGGFAHTIFNEGREAKGLSAHQRVGFFAQQHDLAAAGCRPDIRNDEEYSSYFWGAIAGRTRSGKPVGEVDLNGDGEVSFVEAHTFAVLASKTIDIPLRTSEALLRTYSRIGNYDHRRSSGDDEPDSGSESTDSSIAGANAAQPDAQHTPKQYAASKPVILREMTGTLAQFAQQGSADQAAIVRGLAGQLGLDLQTQVPSVFERFAKERDSSSSKRGSRRRGRSSSRREFLKEIAEVFPDLVDRKTWKESESLLPKNQETTFDRLTSLEGYSRYQAALQARDQSLAERREKEMREVKFQRLINTLEAIVLAQNLPLIAESEVVQHYEKMLVLENSTL